MNSVHADAAQKRQSAQVQWQSFQTKLSTQVRVRLRQTAPRERVQLSPRLRRLYDERSELKFQLEYWENVLALKSDLLALPVAGNSDAIPTPERVEEAEIIAKTAITAFAELKEKYQMGSSALLSNMAINMGLKKEGFCWHWARDLKKRLLALKLQTYNLYWATAREGSIREHNTVVLAPKGTAFEEGLFLDGWRYSGKPFWMRVAEDEKYPWQISSCGNCKF